MLPIPVNSQPEAERTDEIIPGDGPYILFRKAPLQDKSPALFKRKVKKGRSMFLKGLYSIDPANHFSGITGYACSVNIRKALID